MKIVILSIFLVSLIPSIESAYCHESEFLDPSGKYCYVVNKQYKSFHDAEAACYAYGGYTLAKIPNMIDNNFLWNMIRYTGNNCWIGLTDTTIDGNFHWLDGSDLSFTNWASNAQQIPGDCVVMDASSGKWREMPCNYQSNFICYARAQNATTDVPTTARPTYAPIRKETERIMFMIDAESMGDPNNDTVARNFYTQERDFLVSLMNYLVADPNTSASECTYVAGYGFYGYTRYAQDFDHSYPESPDQWINGVSATNWNSTTRHNYGIEDAINRSKLFYWNPEIKDFGYSTLVFLTARQNVTGLPSLDSPKSTFDNTIVLSLNNSPFQSNFTTISISSYFDVNDVYKVLQYLRCH